MARNPIKDRVGCIIGYLEEGVNGETKILDRQGCILGYYDPRTDWTYYRNGSRYAQGNQVHSLMC